MSQSFATQAAEIIRKKAPNITPKIGIVLGSGQTRFAESISDPIVISYEELPGFPKVSVKGQAGQLILGFLNGAPVACLQGRAHPYEGPASEAIKTYIRALKLIGCEIYLASNAAGSFREQVGAGNLVAISDHINLQPSNPLTGPNDDEFGPRFPAMDNAYDLELRQQLQTCAESCAIELHEGVYISVPGPNYETVAEINMYRTMGADVIGMSTVPEVIVARHCGLKVAVVSLVTNLVTGLSDTSHDHDEVVKAANEASDKLSQLFTAFAQTVYA